MLTQQAHENLQQERESFPMGRARELVKDLFRPNPIIYWLDFLFSAILGWGAFVLAFMAPVFSSRQISFCDSLLPGFVSGGFIHP